MNEEPRSWELTIPAPCKWISMNSRHHWAVRAELTRLWRTTARVHAQQAKLPKGLESVHVEARIWKPTNRSYDAHNALPTLKACIDGVVDYGLLVDDSNEYLIGPDVRHGGVGPAAVVLIITEISRSKSRTGT